MRSILAIALASFTTFGVVGQNTSKKAKQLLGQAAQRLEGHDHIYLAFNYKFVNNKVNPPVEQTEQGNIAIKQEDYHLNFLGTEQIKVENKIYTVLAEDKEVQVTEYEEAESEAISPTKILSSYQKGYSYKIDKTVREKGKEIVYIRLKPNVSEEVDYIIVAMEKKTLRIKSLQQFGLNGTVTTFEITEYAPNKKLPANYFTFNKADYEGYYISE